MHQIGSIDIDPGRVAELHKVFGELAWRPDGKAVSFVYDGSLWETAISDKP
jgi:hypothetical protein